MPTIPPGVVANHLLRLFVGQKRLEEKLHRLHSGKLATSVKEEDYPHPTRKRRTSPFQKSTHIIHLQKGNRTVANKSEMRLFEEHQFVEKTKRVHNMEVCTMKIGEEMYSRVLIA
ncbi:hypothetical protein Fot_12788 [Forsythia ovata]|uniref:Uncharacterized protein n=1 Tax=Forsythia ovata TaxID=205694 RepID=A0ABD1W1L8_9LAMI